MEANVDPDAPSLENTQLTVSSCILVCWIFFHTAQATDQQGESCRCKAVAVGVSTQGAQAFDTVVHRTKALVSFTVFGSVKRPMVTSH